MILAFGQDGKAFAQLCRCDFAQMALTLIAAAASISIGYALAAVPRVLAWIQIFVIFVLLQWLLWRLFHIQGQPLQIVATLAAGSLCGYVFRRRRLAEERAEAKHYELMLRNKELKETRLQMVSEDELDRRMLAAGLKDQVLSDLKTIKGKIEDYNKERDPELAKTIQDLLQQAMADIREVMDSLSPSALEHLGLVAAVEDCCRKGAQRSGFKLRFKSKVEEADAERLSKVEQSLLYRLVQESISNISKHAEASLVRGTVDKEDDQLVIRIADDGKGIESSKILDDSRGLRYMRQRADLIGATIAWRQGEEGKGTIVEIRIDLKEKNGHASTDS